MRRYKNWLAALGMVALTPGVTLAGPFTTNPLGTQRPAVTQTSFAARNDQKKPASPTNQNDRVALEIAKAVEGANLSGYDIQVEYKKGVATLKGVVANAKQRLAAEEATRSVKGVNQVENRLEVLPARKSSGVQHANAQMASARASRQPVRQTNMQVEGGPAEAEMPNAPPQIPGDGPVAPAPGYVQGPPPAAAYGYPGSTGSQMVYNQPNMPNYAWPAYAAYPNSAQVSYPKQYSASAWPYIGPFYPYPQVPLGWRKVQLEWEDGYWQLNFRPRTDRWWWFMDYRNW